MEEFIEEEAQYYNESIIFNTINKWEVGRLF